MRCDIESYYPLYRRKRAAFDVHSMPAVHAASCRVAFPRPFRRKRKFQEGKNAHDTRLKDHTICNIHYNASISVSHSFIKGFHQAGHEAGNGPRPGDHRLDLPG